MKLILLALPLALAACSKKDGDKPKPADPPAAKPEVPAPTPTPTPTPTPPPPTAPARAEVPCVDDTNKHMNKDVLMSCVLSADHKVGELTCSKAKVASFYPDGSLKECYLTAPTEIAGFSCQSATALDPQGKLRRCRIEADKEHGGVKLVKGDWVSVYPDGTIHRAEVASRTVTIEGHPCTGYLNYFHANGKLKKCELAADTKVAGNKVAKGTSICFDADGKPVEDCQKLDWQDLVE